MLRSVIVLFLFFGFHSVILSAVYEMDLTSYFKSKYIGKKMYCSDSENDNMTYNGYCKNVYYDEDSFFIKLSSGVICKIRLFTYGLEVYNQVDFSDQKKQAELALLDKRKYLNGVLKNFGDNNSTSTNFSMDNSMNRLDSKSDEKNVWTSKRTIYYTDLNTMVSNEEKVIITSSGLIINNKKVGLSFERESSHEEN